jgi:hypothetical protein
MTKRLLPSLLTLAVVPVALMVVFPLLLIVRLKRR